MPESASSELNALKSLLKSRRIDCVSDMRRTIAGGSEYVLYVDEEAIDDKARRGKITPRQMKLLQSTAIRELGIRIEWSIARSAQASAIEVALNELLGKKLPGVVSSVFVSTLKVAPVAVWIERNAKDEGRTPLDRLRKVIEEFLALFDVKDVLLNDSDDSEVPSAPHILRKIKIHAPVTVEALSGILRSAELVIPDPRWLQRQLDKLRKRGLVVRSSVGEYCPTETALRVVPHNKTRSSSDVERALALGKRKW